MTFSTVLLLFTYYSVIITEEERATALLLMRKDTTTVSIVSTVTDIVRPVVEGEGLDLWAVEFKKEGQVFGIGCKIFTIAGPVILYGIFTSWLLGVIYWIYQLIAK